MDFWQQEISEVNQIVQASDQHYIDKEYFNLAYAHIGMPEGAKNTCTVIQFDSEKGIYIDQEGHEIDPQRIVGNPLVYNPETKTYADINGKTVDLKDMGSPLIMNPETGGYMDVDGNEVDENIVKNVLVFDEEK